MSGTPTPRRQVQEVSQTGNGSRREMTKQRKVHATGQQRNEGEYRVVR